MDLKETGVRTWNGFFWIRTGLSSGLLWTR